MANNAVNAYSDDQNICIMPYKNSENIYLLIYLNTVTFG